MTKKKIMMAAMSAGLVAVVGVGGTLAYLSQTTGPVNNTFTIGEGFVIPDGEDSALKIDETDIENPTGPRTEDGNQYLDLYPGAVEVKDPMVYLAGGSVESYVFATVQGVDELTSMTVGENKDWVFAFDNWGTTYWKKVANLDGTTDNLTELGDGIYVANLGKTVDVSDEAKEEYITLGAPLFSEFTVNPDLKELPENMTDLTDAKHVVINAYAVQYSEDQMDDYTDALDAMLELAETPSPLK